MNAPRLGSSLGLALLALALSGPLALATDQAKGTFRFGKVQLRPVDAIAYQEDGKDPAKPINVVVMTDFPIDRPAVMAAIDTATALWQQALKTGTGNYVMVKVSSPDKCGVSAFLTDGQQHITLSDNFPARHKTSDASRIVGECFTSKPDKMFDDEYEFRLSYDLAITAIPKPRPLPASGGAPGQAFVALVKAIQAANWSVARLHVREEERRSDALKGSELKDYLHGLALNYPKTASITGGLIKGGLAQIEIQGTDYEGRRIRGTYTMRKVGADWRVVEGNMFFAE